MKRRGKSRPARKDLRRGIIPLLSMHPAFTPREMLLLIIVVMSGVALRLAACVHSAVEHFDEGVYASNIFFAAPAYAYPQQRFYAPPLLPALIETGMILGFPPNFAALLPSFLAGCGTIVAVWWFARSWFGAASALAAATLVALSDFHILLSTAALTDALLGLWLVLAVDAIARSLDRVDYRWAVAAGLYTGLAWWTKYNGWLPLAIEAAALVVLWLALSPPPDRLSKWVACFAVTALTAGLVWSPYYFSLQSSGGYAPIAENHAKYLVGLTGWLDSLGRQVANQWILEGPLSKLAFIAALVLPHFLVPRRWLDGLPLLRVALLAGILSLFLTNFVVAAIAAAIGFARFAYHAWPEIRAGRSRAAAIGALVLFVWWAALLVMTPLYSPYPRLVLPWLLAAWIAVALNCSDRLATADPLPPAPWRPGLRGYLAIGACMLLLAICLPFAVPHDGQWETVKKDRGGLVAIARQIRQSAAAAEPRVFYVFGEPAMFFQLRAAGEELVVPVDSVPTKPAEIEGRSVPTFLVAGPHAARDSQFIAALKNASAWRLVEQWSYNPGLLVWLDLNDPRQPPRDDDDVQLLELAIDRSP